MTVASDDARSFALWLGQGPPLLVDARRRLWWAYRDGEILNTAINTFIDSDPYRMWVEFGGQDGKV